MKWVRMLGRAVLVLVLLLLVVLGGIYLVTSRAIGRTYPLPAIAIAFPRDSAALARGKHIVQAITKCGDCHGDDLGGQVFLDDPLIGRLAPTNLTTGKGGVGSRYDDAHMVRAIRHALRQDDHPLIFMPADGYTYLSDEDVAAIVAYVRAVPPVDRDLPPTIVRPLGRILYLLGQFPMLPYEMIDHTRKQPAQSPPFGTPESGRYVASVGGCIGCHGIGLSGGKIPGTPPEWKPASNLTPVALGTWSEAEFTKTLREGIRPGGVPVDPRYMPWKRTALMTDAEIHDVWEYLKTVPSKPYGGR